MKHVTWLLIIVAVVGVCACGKYGPPIPPEALSPRPVQALNVSADTQGVKFTWTAPDADQRGKDLKSMDGYNVYRSEVDPLAAPADRGKVSYELVGNIADKHIAELLRLQKEAIAAGKPTHKVKIDDALKHFEFLDKLVEQNKIYLYKVVPFNQDRVEGQFNQFVKVLFKDETSEITFPKNFMEEEDNVFQ